MTKNPIALAIALAFVTSVALYGCDNTASLTAEEHIQRAKDFEDKGNLKASVVELKNAIQKNPDNPQARMLLGQVYLKVGMGAEAEKELGQAVKLGVSSESLKPQIGEALLLMGEHKRILDEIQPTDSASKPALARIYQLRGDALARLGRLKDACDLYRQSYDLDGNNAAAYWGLAECAVADRDIAKAREWLNNAAKLAEKQAQTWILLGKLEEIDANMEAALASYSNALKIDPANLQALQSRATINTRLGRMGPARADIDALRKSYPNSLAASYLEALFRLKEKKLPEAREAVQTALKVAPDYTAALVLGGLIEDALGNLQTAEAYVNKAVRNSPRDGFARQFLASIQLRQGRPDDANKTLAPIDVEKTRSASLHKLVGEIALSQKDYAKAAAHFEQAATLSPEDASIRSNLGLARLAQGDRSAMADLQTAAEMEDQNTRAGNIVILTQLRQRQFDAALTSIAAFEEKHGASPLSWNYRGAAYQGKKDISRARASFDTAVKMDPKFFPAVVNLAQLDLVEGRPGEARKRFERILKSEPAHLQAMLALADLSLGEKDEKAYASWLEQAIKAHPRAIPPRVALARLHLTRGEPQKALALARDAANASPDNADALDLLGSIQLATGDRSGAISTFTKRAQKSPASGAFLQLALAQIADKRMKEARTTLNKSLQLQPDHVPSQEALLRLELAENNPAAALAIARQIQLQKPQAAIGFDREADILMLQKRYPQAVQSYQQALSKGAGTATFLKLHRALSSAGDKKAADEQLAGWLTRYPKDTAARNYAAETYMRAGRNLEAIAQYEVLHKAEPGNVIVLNNLASLYLREKDPRALSSAEQAHKLAPTHPSVLDTLGWILVEQGHLPRGMELLSKAAASAPKAGVIRYHYGVALARSGKKAEAKKELLAAVSSGQEFPGLGEAQALLRRL